MFQIYSSGFWKFPKIKENFEEGLKALTFQLRVNLTGPYIV